MDPTDMQRVAGLLIGGFVVFSVGAALWRQDYQRPLPVALPAIARSLRRWKWIHYWMIGGVLTTIAGIAGLTQLAVAAGDLVYATAGLVLFSVGGTLWLAGVAWRLTVLVSAARETENGGTVPTSAQPWSEWFGMLHNVHLIAAYLSWVALGSAVLATGMVGAWAGWLGIGLGGFGAAGYIVLNGGPFAMPLLAHVYTLVLGITLLVNSLSQG